MHHGKYRFIVSLLAVPLAVYAVFVVSPYVQAFPIAFTNWEGLSASYQYIGFGNFVTLFHDSVFWVALRHNLFLLVSLPVIIVTLSLFFSAALNYQGGVPGARIYKVVYFFPGVLSIAIIGVLWQFVFEPRNGLLNGFLRAIGLDGLAGCGSATARPRSGRSWPWWFGAASGSTSCCSRPRWRRSRVNCTRRRRSTGPARCSRSGG